MKTASVERHIKEAPSSYIKFPSANDFAKSTSFTISFWMKKSAACSRLRSRIRFCPAYHFKYLA